MTHQSMKLADMIIAFEHDGVVESNSPKNRKKLYEYLNLKEIKFKREVIGYTDGRKQGSRWVRRDLNWDLGRVVKWIADGRLLAEDLKETVRDSWKYNFEDIQDVFKPEMPTHEKYKLIVEKWGTEEEIKDDKWSPFDCCVIRKTIVRITRV